MKVKVQFQGQGTIFSFLGARHLLIPPRHARCAMWDARNAARVTRHETQDARREMRERCCMTDGGGSKMVHMHREQTSATCTTAGDRFQGVSGCILSGCISSLCRGAGTRRETLGPRDPRLRQMPTCARRRPHAGDETSPDGQTDGGAGAGGGRGHAGGWQRTGVGATHPGSERK